MPKFSIIVPVYNVAPYLRGCLDSVLAQTFTDWECLCVNDGSTDESGAILDEYAAKDVRFRVFHKPNGGVSSARNLALDNAKGEWIGFLDGDDVYNPELMAACEAAIVKCPTTDMLRFRHVKFNDGESPLWKYGENELKFVVYQNQLTMPVLDGDFWGRIYRRERVKTEKFPSLILGEDWVWKVGVVEKMSSFIDLEGQLYGYRIRQGSAMNSPLNLKKLLSELHWKNEVWRILKSSKKDVSNCCFRWFELAQTEGYCKHYFKVNSDLRRQVWDSWLNVLNELAHEGRLRWVRFSSRVVFRTRSFLLAFVLFYVPHWLKLRGIHR